MFWSDLGTGIALGLGAAAPIGPVNIEIARRSIRGGFRCGFLLGCGAVTVDTTYLVLASWGVRLLAPRPTVRLSLGMLGAAFLAWLAIGSLLSARRQLNSDILVPQGGPAARHYLTGLLMTSLNPLTLAFWFSAATLKLRGPQTLVPLCAGVAAGAISWVIFFSSLMALAGRASQRATLFLADLLGGITLLGFALYMIWRVVHPPV